MDRPLIYLITLLPLISIINCDTYLVKVATEFHINEVADGFLSFSVDPKYLFSTNEKYTYNRNECICMASSLTPAYLRIAGPSTASLTFQNSSIVINHDIESQGPISQERGLTVSHNQWQKFTEWARTSGFHLVFALNPGEKMSSGIWDANSALTMLTAAARSQVEDVTWQLGYECTNQTLEEYLNDLETLRIIIETFPRGKTQQWKVVGGDVTNCLHKESKSDFKDYVILSNEMMDAIMLNGNSTSYELERMSEAEHMKLLKLLSTSRTPLWLTENTRPEMSEMERAASWMLSLGYSARNGFSVHFRELREDELYEPTLSFYMALLYKNLVGERVLNVDMDPSGGEAALFAHCTSLRHKPVPGAVTLYGVNMDDEPARFSIKLSRVEDGGDILQFILGHDRNGNIIVNGRAMYYEGDIRPVVKRVRPYKTLLINLPPKSFGFWVLANTKIEACHNIELNEINEKRFVEAVPVTDINENKKTKRSVITGTSTSKEFLDFTDYTDDLEEHSIENKEFNDINRWKELFKRVDNINNNLKSIYSKQEVLGNKNTEILSTNKFSAQLNEHKVDKRQKRQILDGRRNLIGYSSENEINTRKLFRRKPVSTQNPRKTPQNQRPGLLVKLLELNARLNSTRQQRINRLKKINNTPKKDFKKYSIKRVSSAKREIVQTPNTNEIVETKNRTRRNIINFKNNSHTDKDNEINTDKHNIYKSLNNLDKSIQKLRIKQENDDYEESNEDTPEQNDSILKQDKSNGNSIEDQIVLTTKLTNKDASINLSEKSNQHGILNSAIESVNILLEDLQERMNKVWSIMKYLE